MKPNVVLVQFPEASKPDLTVQMEYGKGRSVKFESDQIDPDTKPEGYRFGRRQSYFGLVCGNLLHVQAVIMAVVSQYDWLISSHYDSYRYALPTLDRV